MPSPGVGSSGTDQSLGGPEGASKKSVREGTYGETAGRVGGWEGGEISFYMINGRRNVGVEIACELRVFRGLDVLVSWLGTVVSA